MQCSVEDVIVIYSVYLKCMETDGGKYNLPLSGWFRIISFLWASLILFLLAVGLKDRTVERE